MSGAIKPVQSHMANAIGLSSSRQHKMHSKASSTRKSISDFQYGDDDDESLLSDLLMSSNFDEQIINQRTIVHSQESRKGGENVRNSSTLITRTSQNNISKSLSFDKSTNSATANSSKSSGNSRVIITPGQRIRVRPGGRKKT
jgi:hypothetical protein